MKEKSLSTYIIFWLSQSFSQLGSAMTGFALTLWAYQQTESAFAFSMMAFCSYLPYIIVSIIAGNFIDRHKKKQIMAVSDSVAAICSVIVLILFQTKSLYIWQIYLINGILGFMNAFQSPAQSVAIGIMVPEEKMTRASGLDSLSSNLVTVLSPMLATAIYGLFGMGYILVIDLTTFFIAITVLLLFVSFPEKLETAKVKEHIFQGFHEGVHFLREKRGLWYLILTMAVINFFSRLTYENILSPMILARSGQSAMSLSVVTGVLGAGGIVGGIIVAAMKKKPDPVRMMYFSAALSFLCGDLLMGAGRNAIWWSIAGFAASLPIPFVMAGQRVILYQMIPKEIQGRIFAVRNAIQFSTIPVGILLGGFLADYVFEPWMQQNVGIPMILHRIVGCGRGSGMAVMFLCTGILGSLSGILAYRTKAVQELRHQAR